MTNSGNRYKIERIDFGLSLSAKTQRRNIQSDSPKLPFLSLKNFAYLSALFAAKTTFFSKYLIKTFAKLKWNISRSIFLGRGIYFKYISNLSLLIIVIFGTFVYLRMYGKEGETKSFFPSKYAKANGTEGDVMTSNAAASIQLDDYKGVVKYNVGPGDTLSSIAAKFSTDEIKITTDTLIWANNLKTDSLKQGMVLDIPPVSGTLHKAEKGDTVESIARKYGRIKDGSSEYDVFLAVQDIVSANLLDSTLEGDKKVPVLPTDGRRIIVPGGVVIPEPVKQQPSRLAQQPAKPAAPTTKQNIPAVVSQPSRTGYVNPVGGFYKVSSWFMDPRRPDKHTGVDFSNHSAPALVAIDNAIVASARPEAGGGACVIRLDLIDADGNRTGIKAMYAHTEGYSYGRGSRVSDKWVCTSFDSFKIRAGDRVTKGQPIARMGNTGISTGTHLHFEMYNGNTLQNPCRYIPC